MVLPPPEKLMGIQISSALSKLKYLLENSPPTLPLLNVSRYNTFLTFDLDPEILDKTGDEVATLGEQLEYIFGWKLHTLGDGIIADGSEDSPESDDDGECDEADSDTDKESARATDTTGGECNEPAAFKIDPDIEGAGGYACDGTGDYEPGSPHYDTIAKHLQQM